MDWKMNATSLKKFRSRLGILTVLALFAFSTTTRASMFDSAFNMLLNPKPQCGTPADSYGLWGASDNSNLEAVGTATLAKAPGAGPGFSPRYVADRGSMVFFLGAGLCCLFGFRRKPLR
jgi:hypothetical protein